MNIRNYENKSRFSVFGIHLAVSCVKLYGEFIKNGPHASKIIFCMQIYIIFNFGLCFPALSTLFVCVGHVSSILCIACGGGGAGESRGTYLRKTLFSVRKLTFSDIAYKILYWP